MRSELFFSRPKYVRKSAMRQLLPAAEFLTKQYATFLNTICITTLEVFCKIPKGTPTLRTFRRWLYENRYVCNSMLSLVRTKNWHLLRLYTAAPLPHSVWFAGHPRDGADLAAARSWSQRQESNGSRASHGMCQPVQDGLHQTAPGVWGNIDHCNFFCPVFTVQLGIFFQIYAELICTKFPCKSASQLVVNLNPNL